MRPCCVHFKHFSEARSLCFGDEMSFKGLNAEGLVPKTMFWGRVLGDWLGCEGSDLIHEWTDIALLGGNQEGWPSWVSRHHQGILGINLVPWPFLWLLLPGHCEVSSLLPPLHSPRTLRLASCLKAAETEAHGLKPLQPWAKKSLLFSINFLRHSVTLTIK